MSPTRQRRKGAAAVEAAFLLPFLLFLFAVAVDWSRIFYYSITLENCARNGALYMRDPYSGVKSPYKDVTEAALADAKNISPAPDVKSASGSSTVTLSDGSTGTYNYVECTVSYSFKTLTSLPKVPSTTSLSRTVRMYTAPQAPATN